jgi:hypothetical protein
MIEAEPIPSIHQSQFSLTSRPPEPEPETEAPQGQQQPAVAPQAAAAEEPVADIQSEQESPVESIPSEPPIQDSQAAEARAPALTAEPVEAAETVAPALPPAYPQTMKEVYARVDGAWLQFLALASAFPNERMDEHLSEGGWTRKQMLAHISAWHDAAHDRLGDMIMSGKPSERTYDEDQFNARVARQAIGRTAGEVVKEMEMTFNRLRRQLGRLTDQQLVADDGWAASVIAGNTYEHYQEHAADVYQPPPPDGKSGRR